MLSAGIHFKNTIDPRRTGRLICGMYCLQMLNLHYHMPSWLKKDWWECYYVCF